MRPRNLLRQVDFVTFPRVQFGKASTLPDTGKAGTRSPIGLQDQRDFGSAAGSYYLSDKPLPTGRNFGPPELGAQRHQARLISPQRDAGPLAILLVDELAAVRIRT